MEVLKQMRGKPAAAAAVAAAETDMETLQVQACRRHTFLQVFVCPPTSACSVPYRHESLVYKDVFRGYTFK